MRNDDLDNVIDKALADYATPEFPPGLEQRVLNRVHASPERRRFGIPRWAFAVPALALLALVVMVVRIYYTPRPQQPPLVARTETPVLTPPAEVAVPPQRPAVVKSMRTSKAAPAPKQPTFPSPAPMTDQERALVALVENAPVEAGKALSEIARREIEPIQIEEIKIQPLGGDSLQ